MLDVHCTKGLQAVQYIGAVTVLDRGPGGLFAQGGGSGFVHCGDAVEIKSVEQGQAVGICLEVATPLKQSLAYVQVSPSLAMQSQHWLTFRHCSLTQPH